MILSNFLERAPSFLLSRLLLTMDFESSRRFLQTFRRLRWTTETISQESYRITLKTDGLLDNPLCPLNTFSKYHLLLSRRAAWASFLPDYIDLRHLPWMPNSSLRRFSCSPAMFICFGNKEQRRTSFGVMAIQMPYLLPNARTSLSARRRFRHTMFIDYPERLNDMIIGIGASIEEYDLVIFARMFKSENDSKYSISLQFRPNFTDSFNNPPRTSDLPLFRKEISWSPGKPKPRIELLSVGGYVLITTENHGGNDGHANSVLLSLFDMNTKKFIMDDTWVDSSGFAFIDKDVFVNPNLQYGGLDVYHIRPNPSSNSLQVDRVNMLFRFGLPVLETGIDFVTISCRCHPGTTTAEYRRLGTSLPFYDDPREAIIHIEMRVRRIIKSEDFDDIPAQDFVMIVHRSALRKLVQQFQAKVQGLVGLPQRGLLIPYEEWGPSVTRWFKRDITGQRTAYTYGQRYLETKHTVGSGIPNNENRVLLMDFNPSTVQETLRRRKGNKNPIRIVRNGTVTSVRHADPPRLDLRNLALHVDAFGQLGMFGRSIDAQEDPDDILECRGYFKESIVNRLPYVLFVGGEEWSSLNIYDIFIDGPRLIIVVLDENQKRYIRIAFLG